MPRACRWTIAVLTALALVPQSAYAARQNLVVFYDLSYSVRYGGDPDPALKYFQAQGFKHLDTKGLLAWIDQTVKAGQAPQSAVVQLSDVTPMPLVLPWDRTSPLSRYCEAGGRFVAPAGTTLYGFEDEKGLAVKNQGEDVGERSYLTKVFGVHFVYGLTGQGKKLMPAGEAWGLGADRTWLRSLISGVPPADCTSVLAQSEDDKCALAWLKTLNPAHPHSGLVGMVTSLSAFQPLLEAIYKLCVYDGQPVTTVPQVDWLSAPPAPPVGVKLTLKAGPFPRHAYQRGEEIPVTVEVFGAEYKGQAAELALLSGKTTVWRRAYPEAARTQLTSRETIPTAGLRCGEYQLRAQVLGRAETTATLSICPARRANPFPFMVFKDRRANPHREQIALDFIRDLKSNVWMHDMFRMETAPQDPKTAASWGDSLDRILRSNLTVNGHPDSLVIYAKPADEPLILANDKPLTHGVYQGVSWRSYRDAYLEKSRAQLRRQVSLLREFGSPAVMPFFFTHDDASMLGYFDFHPKTMAEFQAQTGLTRADLPPLEHVPWSPSPESPIYMPKVAPGIVPDDHPWLRYMRFHTGNYVTIQQAAMDSIQGGWPGSYVADCGLMSGTLWMPRGYYSPAYMAPLNSNGFYHYPYWSYSYPFQFAAARMGNRDKAPAIVTSLAYTAWGRAFQRDSMYRILVEAPQVVGLYSLDDLRESLADLESECFDTIRDVAGKASRVAPLLLNSRVERQQGALFLGYAQLCFNANDRHGENGATRGAQENFLRAGARLDLLCSEELLAGDASRYRVIFLNGVKWITTGEKAALEAYIRGGGVVVADSTTTIAIEGAQMADGPFATGEADTGTAALVARCRQYVQTLLPPQVAATTSPHTGVFVNRVGDLPLVWVMDLESEEELRAMGAAMGTDWERGVPDYLRERDKVRAANTKTVQIQPGYYAYDLWTSKEVPLTKSPGGWGQGTLQTRLYEAHPLALYRERIAALRVAAGPAKLTRGDTGQFVFGLTGARGEAIRGQVPAEVRVYGPDGKEAWEYGSQALVRDGVLTVPLSIARNDAPGVWRVVVRELCSGLTAEAKVAVGG